ncbi:MAG: MraY family glycosyltransferase [Candidatus Omnitrophica bacterium]|nr:MraY family glycosyltransferase [Candidatus Omnitrophota bacterium]
MLKVFAFSLISSIIFTWAAMWVAGKFGILDYPDERKVHLKPTPLLGGLAVFGAFALAIVFNYRFSLQLKGIMIGSSIILLAGLIDDVKELSAFIRLIVQIICALTVVACGVHIKVFTSCASIEAVLTVLWIVGITNAMNFIDGLDGLAAGITAIAAGTFSIIACQTNQVYFSFLTLALTGACLGFLVFNFHPAKIFLGDAGSSFIGFTLASLAVMGDWSANSPVVALSVPLLILSILIFDITYISISRVYQGKVKTFKEWIEYVGRDHLHHRLMALGLTTVQSVLFIYLLSTVFAVSALVLRHATHYEALLLLIQDALILLIVTVLMVVGKENLDKNKDINEATE